MKLRTLLTQGIIWRGFYFFSILLVNIFLSRYLQAAGTGNLYLITIILSFAQVLLSLGFDAGVVYFGAGNIIERNKLIGLIGVWSFGAGIIILPLMYLFFMIDHTLDQSLLVPYCFYAFFYVTGQSLANYSTAVYYTQENYFLPNLLYSLTNFVFIILIPAKNKSTDAAQVQWVIYMFFATYFVGGLSIFISFIIKNYKKGIFGFPNGANFKKFFKYSITALAANVIFFLVYRIDYLFVNASPVCTAADLGNYIQVSKLGQMLLIVPQIIASVVYPRTASGADRTFLNNVIMAMARIMSQLFLVLFIIVALFGNLIFTKVFGGTFNKMQLPMLIVLPGIFALSVLALLSAYFSGKGNLKVNLHGAIIALIIMITGDYFLVFKYGIIAAAAVSTISYIANLSYSLLQFYRDYSIKWIEFVKWKKTDYTWLLSLIKKDIR